ncbi:hypothetical protein [Methylorubrum thiocyanatum]|uniref:hypothetical protein n=1 Tax=Methylorubrum thiocyanatum TaxID=47958 RepID=UPI00398C7CE2
MTSIAKRMLLVSTAISSEMFSNPEDRGQNILPIQASLETRFVDRLVPSADHGGLFFEPLVRPRPPVSLPLSPKCR